MTARVATATAGRTLPHNLEAERSVLGGIIIANRAFHSAASVITPQHFFRDAHRRIATAIWKLADANEAIDLVTVKEAMSPHDLEEAGGPAYIASLVDGVPRSDSVFAYAEIVKDKATKRNLIYSGAKILDRAYDDEDSAETVVTWAEQQVFDLAHGHLVSKLTDQHDSGRVLLADLEFREANRGKVTGVDTGFPGLNEQTHGWQHGDLIFVGARPSIGKTTFVMNSITLSALHARSRAVVFSMEMRKKQLQYRMLAQLSGVPLSRMLAGALGGTDYGAITNALETLSELPIWIDDRPARTIWDIRSACRQQQIEHGLDVVVIDYVQLMRGTIDRKGATRNDELTDISNRLKALSGELNVPIIVLSQLARKSQDRPDPRPKMSDLKDCGAFEQDADVVVLLHRANHREGGITNAIFEKQRNGPTGTRNITLDRDIVTFTDGGEEPPPPPKAAEPPRERRRSRAQSLRY